MRSDTRLLVLLSATVLFTFLSCRNNADLEKAAGSINAGNLSEYVSVLASDDFQGRKPVTAGEDKTIGYLVAQFKKIGLEPGMNGSYIQPVDMVEISSVVDQPAMVISSAGQRFLRFPDDLAVVSPELTNTTEISNSEMVFAGFGIVAPEYGWNDYRDLDVKGKTVVVLVNDPGLYTGDSTLFKGTVMTYYGRWTYKYEEAARQGARGLSSFMRPGAQAIPGQSRGKVH